MTGKQVYMAIRKRCLLALRGRFFIVRRKRGLSFLVDILNYIDREIEAFGSYENKQISQLLAKIRERNATFFIDIGANIGLYSISVAKIFPKCEILAFEPDRRNFCQFHANLFLNGLEDRVRVEPYAISASSGQACFTRHEAENRGRSRVESGGGFVVETRRLDDLLEISGGCVAIKIDVEGHEYDVIAGATKLLTNNDVFLQIESFSSDRIEGQLAALGYRVTGRTGHDLTFERNRRDDGSRL